tara:strand:+ start:98 stop:415 length:318 start_codon:yes stop_codon:yes gene_type:complete
MTTRIDYRETPAGLEVVEVNGSAEYVTARLPARKGNELLRRIGELFELGGATYEVTRVTPCSAWARTTTQRTTTLVDVKTDTTRQVIFRGSNTIQVGTYREAGAE